MCVTASAPGKIILMGEHAAVYGRPALVAAVDRRLYAHLTETPGRDVRLELPEVEVSETVSWDHVWDYARAARRRWSEYQERPGPEAFRRLRGDDPAHLVKVALGEAARLRADSATPGVELRLRSEIPIGAGFGSSAAAAMAIACAYLRLCGVEVAMVELERLGLEIERRQHGSPSGIDTATVIRGGLVWAARDAADRLSVAPVPARAADLGRIRVFNSGTPAESTGAVVAAVRAGRDADPEQFERLLERMEAATLELRRQLEGGGQATEAGGTPAPRGLLGPIREFEACLEEIGVVPTRLRQIVREVESRGGAAKISGAGALSGTGAGSLLVYHPRVEEIDGWGSRRRRASDTFLDRIERLDVRLGAEGVRVEV